MGTRYDIGDKVVVKDAPQYGWDVSAATITNISKPTKNETYYELEWGDGLVAGTMEASDLRLVARKEELERKGFYQHEWELTVSEESRALWRPKNPDTHGQKVELNYRPNRNKKPYEVRAEGDYLNKQTRNFNELAEAVKAVYATLTKYKTGKDFNIAGGK